MRGYAAHAQIKAFTSTPPPLSLDGQKTILLERLILPVLGGVVATAASSAARSASSCAGSMAISTSPAHRVCAGPSSSKFTRPLSLRCAPPAQQAGQYVKGHRGQITWCLWADLVLPYYIIDMPYIFYCQEQLIPGKRISQDGERLKVRQCMLQAVTAAL